MANTAQPNGGLSSFDDFHGLHWERTYRAVTSITREPDTAVEAVDWAMAQAVQSWDVVSEYEEPAGWVFRMALRRSRSSARWRSPVTDVARGRLPDPIISDAFAELPFRIRAVIVAHFYLDWSTQQIAEALRLPLRTVENRLHRGLRRIERALGEQT